MQQAIHVWTRVLFLDRGNRSAREWIDRARRAIAEQQRQGDVLVHDAEALLRAGRRDEAVRHLAQLLAGDPRHVEARALWQRLHSTDRRSDSRRSSKGTSVATAPPRTHRNRRARPLAAGAARPRPAPPFRVAVFFFCSLCFFAAGAIYLSLNWDFLVSQAPFAGSRRAAAAPGEDIEAPPPPTVSDVHYFQGARLHADGRYREALSELRRVDRRSASYQAARRLILMIEGRLLRGGGGGDAGASTPQPRASS